MSKTFLVAATVAAVTMSTMPTTEAFSRTTKMEKLKTAINHLIRHNAFAEEDNSDDNEAQGFIYKRTDPVRTTYDDEEESDSDNNEQMYRPARRFRHDTFRSNYSLLEEDSDTTQEFNPRRLVRGAEFGSVDLVSQPEQLTRPEMLHRQEIFKGSLEAHPEYHTHPVNIKQAIATHPEYLKMEERDLDDEELQLFNTFYKVGAATNVNDLPSNSKFATKMIKMALFDEEMTNQAQGAPGAFITNPRLVASVKTPAPTTAVADELQAFQRRNGPGTAGIMYDEEEQVLRNPKLGAFIRNPKKNSTPTHPVDNRKLFEEEEEEEQKLSMLKKGAFISRPRKVQAFEEEEQSVLNGAFISRPRKVQAFAEEEQEQNIYTKSFIPRPRMAVGAFEEEEEQSIIKSFIPRPHKAVGAFEEEEEQSIIKSFIPRPHGKKGVNELYDEEQIVDGDNVRVPRRPRMGAVVFDEDEEQSFSIVSPTRPRRHQNVDESTITKTLSQKILKWGSIQHKAIEFDEEEKF